MIDNDKILNLDAPSERLKYLRSLTRLNRSALAEKYGIPEITLRQWENGKIQLTEKAIKRCLELYRKEGIVVTEEWLRNGSGLQPSFSEYFLTQAHNSNLSIRDDINKDLEYFKANYPNSVIYKILNNEMLPTYNPNDVVIGLIYNGDINKLNNKDCIVVLDSNETLFRRLIVAEKSTFNLHSTNPLLSISDSILYNARIKLIAPIIWHRLNTDLD